MEKVELKKIVHQIRGVSYKPEDLSTSSDDEYVTLLRANNIGNSQITNLNDVVFVSKDKVKKDQYLQHGDILIAASSGSIEIVGKSAIVENPSLMTFGAFCKVIRPKKELVNPKYIGFFFQTEYYRKRISFLAQGANINNLRNEHIDNLEIPLPEFETQNKIVAILSKTKAILDKREEAITKYDKLLKNMFLEMFGDPVLNPKGWEMISLKQLCHDDWRSGGTPSRSKQEYFVGEIPWVTSGELNDIYISSTKESISEEAIVNSNAKLIPANSLLIGMYDTAALKSSINTIPLACNQAIAYAQINEQKCRLLYVYIAIQIGKDFFKSNQRGVRQQNLNLSMIKQITIPKPPIKLQAEFELRLNKLFMFYSNIKKSRYIAESLLKSLSQQIFSERITIDVDAELEALINVIDLDKKDSENNIETIKKDVIFLQRLLDKLNELDFENKEQYDKAKYIVFRIMKEEENLIKQVFEDSQILLTLKNEIA